MRALGTVQLPTEAFMAVLKLDEEKLTLQQAASCSASTCTSRSA